MNSSVINHRKYALHWMMLSSNRFEMMKARLLVVLLKETVRGSQFQ
jgi:hypothetical protein